MGILAEEDFSLVDFINLDIIPALSKNYLPLENHKIKRKELIEI